MLICLNSCEFSYGGGRAASATLCFVRYKTEVDGTEEGVSIRLPQYG